jgi:hypothetical protein
MLTGPYLEAKNYPDIFHKSSDIFQVRIQLGAPKQQKQIICKLRPAHMTVCGQITSGQGKQPQATNFLPVALLVH